MFLELDSEQHRLLMGLVDARVREIPSEIRRCRDYRFHDELKHDLEVMRNLLQRLHEAEYDVRDCPSNFTI